MSIARFETPRIFLYGIAVLVPLFVIWTGLAEVERVVRVEGVMIPVGRSRQIQHLEGGIIGAIAVREGQAVRKGDLLLTVDNTTAGASLSETKVKLDSQQTRIARLQAEIDGRAAIVFPPQLKETPVAAAEIGLFEARKKNLEQEISVHENLIRQHNADIDEAKSRITRLQSELGTASERVAMMERMAQKNAASKLEVLDAQSRQQRLKTEIGEVMGSIPRLNASIGEERSRMEAARSDFHARAQDELSAALAEHERLKQTLSAVEDRLKRTEIRAPIDGVVNHIFVNTVGGVIRSGENLIELIPDTSEVLIEARAHPRDRGFLRPGLPVSVRVSAYDTAEYGLLHGVVTEVGADSLEGAHDETYYEVDVKVDTVPDRYKGHPMVPGMTVVADVVTGRRTVLNYILSPLRKFTYNMFRDSR